MSFALVTPAYHVRKKGNTYSNTSTEVNTYTSIVFSFWTSTLDLIEKGLSHTALTHTRYDGNTTQANRSLALKKFRQDPSISVILMTISCSAVGYAQGCHRISKLLMLTYNSLDITAASRAYIMEPQWNPTVEEQALARVHRMGQTKAVTTIRFVMEGTFEEVHRIHCLLVIPQTDLL
jgi:SWI/SNF-related matrix-associated actin-dependent regulator of chromatin subfamily A3